MPTKNPFDPWADVYGAPGGPDPFAPGANLPNSYDAPDISEPVMMGGPPGTGGFDWGTAGAGAGVGGEFGGALGSIADLIFGGEDRKAANDYLQKILSTYQDFNPNEQVSVLGPSAFNTIHQDPNLRGQEMATLAHLKGVADSGGLDAQGRAKLADVQRSNAEAAYGQQRGIQARAARRGSSAPGLDLISSQVAAQGAADRNAASGLNIAADAEDRALQAALSGGQMAGQMGRDDWTRSAQTAGANDAVSRFNAQNLQNVYERNLNRDWQRRQGMAGAYGDLAQGKLNDATRWSRIGSGIGRGAGGIAGFFSGGLLGKG
jgi:hypothetical protein